MSLTLNALGLASWAVSARPGWHTCRVHPARAVAWALPGSRGPAACSWTAAAASPWPLLLVAPVFANAVFANLVMDELHGARNGARARTARVRAPPPSGLLMFAPELTLATPLPGWRRRSVGGADGRRDDGLHSVLATAVFAAGRTWVGRHPESEAALVVLAAR